MGNAIKRQTLAPAFSVGMMLVGCGPEAPPATETATTEDQVHAMAPPTSCDPDIDVGWWRISTDRVRCANGF
ncbi:hypothetical protein HPP05_16890 [Corallococcus exiguus]|uniref:hypothetical protein n=1 Tax=Corallococcus exiguus TaxID=83462 RepID=UPI0014945FD4|nr:hypothetical protein [Corallococcus exiguus]NPC71428.1 hypothetical protein [Corallococcus exiguus]